jgi:5,6-dimethylbenzimidazole synthase
MAEAPNFDPDFRSRLQALLTWRRDVRRFRRDPLPDGTIERLIGLACLAPSVGLSQPWRFVLVDLPARRAAVRENFLHSNAAALAEPGRLTMPETIAYSAVMATHTLWLTARAEGIGMGWISILEPVAVAAALDAPADWRLIGYFCLGYPADTDTVPALERAGWEHRRNIEECLIYR